MITDTTIKAAAKARLQAGSGDNTKVVIRQKLALRSKDWLAALRSPKNSAVTDGWMIVRDEQRTIKLGTNHWVYEWDYVLLYALSIREGNETDNSDIDLNALLERVKSEFERNPTLGFDTPYTLPDGFLLTFDQHGELQIEAYDTINNELHFIQARLTCFLTKQGQ